MTYLFFGDSPPRFYREIYECVFGMPWDEARSQKESIQDERLPDRLVGLSEDEVLRLLDEEIDRLLVMNHVGTSHRSGL